MNNWLILLLISLCFVQISAQGVKTGRTDLQKLVETEQAFARTAAEKGTKTAFLTYLADDGIIFNPTEANGKLVWKARADSPALLSWNPAWADISSDGRLGFTTGGWEFRPNGKNDKPVGFGEYVTIWQRQSDGAFKAVLDIGITHPASSFSLAAWRAPFDAGTGAKAVKKGVDNAILTDIFSNKSMANGYFNYLADDAVVLREGFAPFYGRQNAFFALERLEKEFPSSAFLTFDGNMSKIFGNMMYVWGVYQLKEKDNAVKKWNFVQIWKNRGGKWQLVLDIFSPIKAAQK